VRLGSRQARHDAFLNARALELGDEPTTPATKQCTAQRRG
jgi:hypothetical protein